MAYLTLICLILAGCTQRLIKQESEDILEARDTLTPGLEVSVTRSREVVLQDTKAPQPSRPPRPTQARKRAAMKKSTPKKAVQVLDKDLSVYAPCDCTLQYEKSSDGSYTVNLISEEFKGQFVGVTNVDEKLTKVKRGHRIGTTSAHLKVELDKTVPDSH